MSSYNLGGCFIGATRYSQPLDTTTDKKFRTLAQLGKMRVIGFSTNFKPRRFSQECDFYLLPHFSLPVLRYLTMFLIGPLLALWCILKHDVRILVAQSPYEGWSAAWAKRVARLFGKRVALVIESHGDFEVSLFMQRPVLFPGVYRFIMKWVARFALRHADILRAVSDSTREQLERWMPGKTIVQFHTWTDIEAFVNAGRNSKVGSKKAKQILYAGVLIPRKGIHFLIDSFSKVANEIPASTLLIIGKPENRDYADQLKKQVRQMGLVERVIFQDQVPQAELAEKMAESFVFVLPTQSEGLPRVVFEAMSTGTPVIASAVSGIPEIIKDGQTGFLINPGDSTTLTERLLSLFHHPQEAHQMGQRARAFAVQSFSKDAYLKGYARLLKEAADHAGIEHRQDGNETSVV